MPRSILLLASLSTSSAGYQKVSVSVFLMEAVRTHRGGESSGIL